MNEVVAVCPECNGPADRQFSPNLNIHIPTAFRATSTAGWHLPPRGDKRWEGMDREGRTRANSDRPETLREHCRKAGVRGV